MKTPKQLVGEILERIAQLKELPEIQEAKKPGSETLCLSFSLDTYSYSTFNRPSIRIFNGESFDAETWEGLLAEIESRKPQVARAAKIAELKRELAELEAAQS